MMNRQPDASPGLEWAKRVLELELPADANPEQLKGAALDSFFRGLGESDYFPETVKSEAVEVIFGKSPNLSREFNRSIEQQHLRAIDAIVERYSSQLGLISVKTAQEELREQLSPYLSQTSPAAVRTYAEQVQLAAKVTESPLNESNSLARTLAQAVFHIAAIRPSQRRTVRMNWVNRLQDLNRLGDLHVAAMIVESQYRIPNHKFHQPFLQLVRWPEEQTELFKIADPVSSDTRSVVAYSKDFGRSHQPAPQATGSSNWAWVAFAIFCGLLISVVSQSPNPPTPKSKPNEIRTPKVRVIVFDKDDPNKFAYKDVEFVESLRYPKEPAPSDEHPGPFVKVPLHWINPVEPSLVPPTGSQEAKSREAKELPLRSDHEPQGGSK